MGWVWWCGVLVSWSEEAASPGPGSVWWWAAGRAGLASLLHRTSRPETAGWSRGSRSPCTARTYSSPAPWRSRRRAHLQTDVERVSDARVVVGLPPCVRDMGLVVTKIERFEIASEPLSHSVQQGTTCAVCYHKKVRSTQNKHFPNAQKKTRITAQNCAELSTDTHPSIQPRIRGNLQSRQTSSRDEGHWQLFE